MSFALNPKPHDSGRLAMWLQPSLSQRFGVFNRHWKIHGHCGESKVAVTSVESNLKGSKWRSGAAIAEMGQDSLFVESLVTATQNAFKWLLHMFALPFYFGSWHVLTTIWSQVLAARNLRSQSHSPGFWRGLAASIAIFRAFLSLLQVYHNNIQVLSFFDFRWFEIFEEPRNVSDRGIQELQKKQKEPLWKCTSVWIKHAKTEIASEAKDITEHRPLRSMYHTVVVYLDILTVTVTCFNLQRIQFSHVLCVCDLEEYTTIEYIALVLWSQLFPSRVAVSCPAPKLHVSMQEDIIVCPQLLSTSSNSNYVEKYLSLGASCLEKHVILTISRLAEWMQMSLAYCAWVQRHYSLFLLVWVTRGSLLNVMSTLPFNHLAAEHRFKAMSQSAWTSQLSANIQRSKNLWQTLLLLAQRRRVWSCNHHKFLPIPSISIITS